jgi:hypothetical protein
MNSLRYANLPCCSRVKEIGVGVGATNHWAMHHHNENKRKETMALHRGVRLQASEQKYAHWDKPQLNAATNL